MNREEIINKLQELVKKDELYESDAQSIASWHIAEVKRIVFPLKAWVERCEKLKHPVPATMRQTLKLAGEQ